MSTAVFTRKPTAPACYNAVNVTVITVRRDDDHTHLRRFDGNLPSRLKAAHDRHRNIHQGDLGPMEYRKLYGIAAIVSFGDDLHCAEQE